jgi:hypothetical protein
MAIFEGGVDASRFEELCEVDLRKLDGGGGALRWCPLLTCALILRRASIAGVDGRGRPRVEVLLMMWVMWVMWVR